MQTAPQIISSYYHTPGESYQHLFHSVLRAGHVRLPPDYRVMSWSRPGHDFVLTLAGSGTVQIGKRLFTIGTDVFCWTDCRKQGIPWRCHSKPWEFLWIRVESEQLNLLADALKVENDPIFKLRKTADAMVTFKTVFRLLRERPVAIDAALHAALTSLIAVLFELRQSAAARTPRERQNIRSASKLDKVLNAMRIEYQRRWQVKDLAQLIGLSVPQFFNRFKQATGSAPMDWLRRERVSQAKRRLVETDDRIRDVAEQVGYCDPLYFSRDFKKVVGLSPRLYRRREKSEALR